MVASERKRKVNLRTVGPTLVHPEVAKAIEGVEYHRTLDFKLFYQRMLGNLRRVFCTTNDVFVFAGSGTNGMTASVANFFSPGDSVLVLSNGAFGKRFADITHAMGLTMYDVSKGWSIPLGARDAEHGFACCPNARAVFVVHNETSTGIVNDVAGIARVAHEHGALVVVDSISGVGAVPLRTDAWDLDVVITASQKALMSHAGLYALSVSRRAWGHAVGARLPRFSDDIRKYGDAYVQKREYPWTPPAVMWEVAKAVEIILRQGVEETWEVHARRAERFRHNLSRRGFSFFGGMSYWTSPALTAVMVPNGRGKKVEAEMAKRGIIVAEGQGGLAGHIVRIGHMGYVVEKDLREAADALDEVFRELQLK